MSQASLNHHAVQPLSNNSTWENREGETPRKYTASLQLGEGRGPTALWPGAVVDSASQSV